MRLLRSGIESGMMHGVPSRFHLDQISACPPRTVLWWRVSSTCRETVCGVGCLRRMDMRHIDWAPSREKSLGPLRGKPPFRLP